MPSFTTAPILNSPYEAPSQHWQLDADGRPTDNIEPGRRISKYFIPIPKSRQTRQQREQVLALNVAEAEKNNEKVNAIRHAVEQWRNLPPDKQRVTDETRRLLAHWREGKTNPRLFYCQVEAAETLIWLNEVAPKDKAGKEILAKIAEENDEANAGLFRLAAKMATGSGKTTVMAMLIAYHTINKIRNPRNANFANHFLVITPGITIKDRLRVLLPQDPSNYYKTRGLVPPGMRDEVQKADVIITNYHAFMHRETLELTKSERQVLQGNSDTPLSTLETDGKMLSRVCSELLRADNIIVINDEAHHCYKRREYNAADTGKGGDAEPRANTPEERDDIKKNDEAARVWINGIYALLNQKKTVRTIYDLSATPFFLAGSGYRVGTLFPWVVSDYSLMDAIESGITKLPRVPVEDSAQQQEPIYRNLYAYISKKLPKRGGQKNLDPQRLPTQLTGALQTLYDHYKKTSDNWAQAKIKIPPAFIVVCNNTSTSRLVYSYLSGYETKSGKWRHGKFDLFDNVGADGKLLPRPRTLLIDSYQLESGDTLTKEFKKVAATEIQQFKEDMRIRYPDRQTDAIADSQILREAMNTVGQPGKLGEQIRCVVSVSMLTEGWDTNNVTHILGVRAFGTQLLCEQVIGRGLRRFSYRLQDDGKFKPEYANVFGVPFNFSPSTGNGGEPPERDLRVRHLDERAHLEIVYPQLRGYIVKPPEEIIIAKFTANSRYTICPKMGPAKAAAAAIIGEGAMMTLDELKKRRLGEVEFFLTAHTIERYYKEAEGDAAPARFRDLLPIVREWIANHIDYIGDTFPQYCLWTRIADEAAERIYRACVPHTDDPQSLLPMMDAYTPEGSTLYVDFMTAKKRYHETRKSHINIAVCDSSWELKFCQLLEADPAVCSYARNDRLHFEVPYKFENEDHVYLPDFVVLIDDGHGKDDLLHLVVEIKGERDEIARTKADTMHRLWVPAVNNDGRWGRWAFAEIMDPQNFKTILQHYTNRKEKLHA